MINMVKQKRACYFIEGLICVIVLLLPLVRYYNVVGISIGLSSFLKILLLVLLCFLLIFRRKRTSSKSLNLSKAFFLLFFIYGAFITTYYEFFTRIRSLNVQSVVVMVTTFVIIVLFFYSQINIHRILKIYSKFVFILLTVYMFQWVLFLSGSKIPFNLPFHSYTNSYQYLDGTVFGMDYYPTSLFSERAHLCEYLLPYLVFALYGRNFIKKGRIIKSIIVTIAIVSTISGNGIVVAALIWLFYFIFFIECGKGMKIISAILGVGLIVSTYFILANIEPFSSMFDILFVDRARGISSYTKAGYRVYRGFDLFSMLPSTQKMFGVGFGHMQSFASENNIVSIFDKTGEYEFFNVISQVLLYYGIVGFVLFLFHLFYLFRMNNNVSKGLIIVFFALGLSTQFLFQDEHIFYMFLIVSTCNHSIILPAKKSASNEKPTIAALRIREPNY